MTETREGAPESYDVVIVGAGVCGAIMAVLLRECGVPKILVLEAGESGPERSELVGNFASAAIKTPGSPYLGGLGDAFAPGPETDKNYYQHDQSGTPDTFKSTYLRRVGGSTWHFLGNVPRLIPSDFQMHTKYGVAVDWPITYDDLEHDYCDAEELLGVAGDDVEWNGLLDAHRSRPFPMPAIWASYSDRKLKPRLEQLVIDGTPVRVHRTPQARNSQPWDGRPPCAGNSSCVPICPIQAKYDATVHVHKARALGVEIRERAVVVSLERESGSAKLSGVTYRTWDKQVHAVSARVVVLAAHAIETVKILLLSRPDGGLANSSGQVGQNLMDHPQVAGGCTLPEPVYPFRGPPTTSGVDVFRDGPFRSERGAFRLSLGNDGWGRIESPVKTVRRLVETNKLFGSRLRDEVESVLTHQFRVTCSTEMLPEATNQVRLSASAKDKLDIPKPALRFELGPYSHRALIAGRSVLRTMFLKLGADEKNIRFYPPGDGEFSGAGHIIGTCRMGADGRSAVVNSSGQSFDHPNLVIVGTSVFPTAGTANPTLTAVALTIRAARGVRDLLRSAV